MKKLGYLLLLLSVPVHIAVYSYNRYKSAEEYADRSGKLEWNSFISRLEEKTPSVLHLTMPYDTIAVPDANRKLAVFSILPSIMSYKYQVDASSTLTPSEKQSMTDEILVRVEQIKDIDEAQAYSSEIFKLNIDLGVAQEEYNEQQRTRSWISLAIFVSIYLVSVLLIFAGSRKQKVAVTQLTD